MKTAITTKQLLAKYSDVSKKIMHAIVDSTRKDFCALDNLKRNPLREGLTLFGQENW